MIVCGIDDAGRGSMLGPLVIAGITLERSKIKSLTSMGVKDSKKLTPITREKLYKKIINFVDDYYAVKISPYAIDRSVRKHQLNSLEAVNMAKVISKLEPQISYVDSCDVNPKRFGKQIADLSRIGKVRSYHHADSRFVVVSAASIIAKVTRDREIRKLQKIYDIGSGYPSDKKTVSFVKNSILNKKNIPKFIRTSWKPVQKLLQQN